MLYWTLLCSDPLLGLFKQFLVSKESLYFTFTTYYLMDSTLVRILLF